MKTTSMLGTLAVAALLLTSCAGSAGSTQTGGEGFEYGAPQDEVNSVISDLEPVKLTYQPAAASPNSIIATAGEAYKEYVEERSNGQIELEIVYGRAIAGYDEIDDALADGRLDLSFHVPIYHPSDYPTYDALATAFHSLPSSPITGEAVYLAVAEEIGWSSPALLEEYETMGITPISPMLTGGGYYPLCSEPLSGSDSWKGRQVRIGNSSQVDVVSSIGASPVSMEYEEVYDGLQRGTVDCTVAQLPPSAEAGIIDVAPHLNYSSSEHSMSGRTSPALLAGSSFQQLPVAYQQILFDGASVKFAELLAANTNATALAVEQVKDADGSFTQLDQETERSIGDAQDQLVEQLITEGRLDQDITERIQESATKWTQIAEKLEVTDLGEFEDMDEWWTEDAVDFLPFAERVFQEAALEHRPS